MLAMNKDIKEAIKIFKEGGIVIFPTDTAFGVGCRIDDEKAIERLFRIRKRPRNQATPVLVDSVKMAQEYLLPIAKGVVDKLINPYWPGALTIILSCNKLKVPSLVRARGSTLGVRMPDHSTALALIRGVGVPILCPSANFHGDNTPYAFEDLNQELVMLVDYTLRGECLLKKPSTVIDCSKKPWQVVRHGAIDMGNALLIDSSSSKQIKVGIRINRKEYTIKQMIGKNKAQVLLTMIDKLLKERGIRLKDLTLIEVKTRPGSFTGIRVGVAIANALSYTLKIPVNSIDK